jgi:hypothetical protein
MEQSTVCALALERYELCLRKSLIGVVLIFLISSSFEIGFTTFLVKASEETVTLKMTTLENVTVLENGTVRISILMNASSGPLADMYRKMLAAPSGTGVGEAVPIPEYVTEKTDVAGHVIDVSVPVREGFYDSIEKEQLLSLGLRVEVVASTMIPRSSGNECIVLINAVGFPEILGVAVADSRGIWDVSLGPCNTTGIFGLVLTRFMFTQMMLESLP